jgi:4-hydroxy-tetrahydrodipicolinate reductase
LDDNLKFCAKTNVPLVICTTGYTAEQEQKIITAAKQQIIFKTSNTSLGIYVLRKLIRQATTLLKD